MEPEFPLNASRSQPTPTPILGARACTNCARVKCKCIYRADGITCERCHRLKKECIASSSFKRRRGPKRSVSRAARLEEKLTELVSCLQAKQGAEERDRDETLGSIGEQAGFEPEADTPSVASLGPATATNSLGGITLPNAAKTAESEISFPDEPSTSEAEELVKKFREESIGFFPFLYIPPHVTSHQLREMYPFLWLNIVCTKLSSAKRRYALGDQIRSMVIQKVVIDREKSLDLLLGLLTFVGWAHLQRKDKPYWTLFSQLIVTLVCDMGLHRPQPDGPTLCAIGKDNDSRITNVFRIRTHEAQRAVLGAFIITSQISNIFKHAPGLRWSSHLDGYVSNLSQNSTVSQDESLVVQVRMQLLVNQVYDESWQNPGSGSSSPLYISALRSQLHDINRHNKLDTPAKNHPMITLFHHYTELLISESAISKPAMPWNEPDFRRFEVYQSCLASIKAYLDVFFSTSVAVLGNMAFTSYPQVVRVMKSLHRITTVQDPAWDRAAVRRSVDLIPTCDKLIGTLEFLRAASNLASPDGSEDESTNLGLGVFRKMRAAWQSELDSMDAANTASREVSMIDGGLGVFATSTNSWADPWLSNVFNDFWE
ncbi:hypothetical protein F5Y05DRAFT_369263 [Hypoxylon sp. FL0543]|nr:hypothetical protein F5Y05DRAFT_369263 [Hypoxylon sp. FL0543]